jgi:CheY-like chemotaxis protein
MPTIEETRSERVILIIDDSATIRRLVDSELSAAGFFVITAPNAEDGILKAAQEMPDLILLDHQLPGTTGYDVCTQLVANEKTRYLPVVISSTLRKKAYAEYVDLPNVVDMLPKPYTPELLITTVQNALDTATMVVNSQSNGSAVPEVIEQQNQSTLSGTIGTFSVREVLDLLNNGLKSGSLELESNRYRIWIFVDHGRIQAVTASGIDYEEVAAHIPPTLSEVTPILKFTVGGRRCSEINGIVELLNNKVLDPRLLKQLLRRQAAFLVSLCFLEQPHSFRFEHDRQPPPLFKKLPLQTSLASLLVEGVARQNQSIDSQLHRRFVRSPIRGQNLDRTGLSSKHLKLMGLLSEARSIGELAEMVDWSAAEVCAAVSGFEYCDLVEEAPMENPTRVHCISKEVESAKQLNQLFAANKEKVSAKVVRDWIAIRLLLRKQAPEAIVVVLDQQAIDEIRSIKNDISFQANEIRWIAIAHPENESNQFDEPVTTLFDAVVQPGDDAAILDAISCVRLSAV